MPGHLASRNKDLDGKPATKFSQIEGGFFRAYVPTCNMSEDGLCFLVKDEPTFKNSLFDHKLIYWADGQIYEIAVTDMWVVRGEITRITSLEEIQPELQQLREKMSELAEVGT